MGDYLQMLQYALGMVVLALPDDLAATSNTFFGVDKWKAEDMFDRSYLPPKSERFIHK